MLALIVLYTSHYAWLGLALLILAGLLAWLLPKAVRLEVEEPRLTVADGPSSERLKMDWESEAEEPIHSGHVLWLAVLLGAAAVILLLARYFV